MMAIHIRFWLPALNVWQGSEWVRRIWTFSRRISSRMQLAGVCHGILEKQSR
jgi:hypothetical protein